jgi:hypothetical protein
VEVTLLSYDFAKYAQHSSVMSLDGFVAGNNMSLEEPFGDARRSYFTAGSLRSLKTIKPDALRLLVPVIKRLSLPPAPMSSTNTLSPAAIERYAGYQI